MIPCRWYRHLLRLRVVVLFSSVVFTPIGAELCPDHRVRCTAQQTCCPTAAAADEGEFGFMCCPTSNATCCSDGIHCCGQGSDCDLNSRRCIPPSGAPDPSIPDWFFNVLYCVTWRNPYKLVQVQQCSGILEQTDPIEVCTGDRIDRDCFRSVRIEFSAPESVPDWWAAVQVLSNSLQWATSFALRVPSVAPAWMHAMQICFYKNGSAYCGVGNQWTKEFMYEGRMIGSFGFVLNTSQQTNFLI